MRGEDRWVFRPRPLARPSVRLVCIPYAGGAAQVFAPWADALPPTVDLCAVQLPGRANRRTEEPYRSVGRIVPALADALRPWLDVPFVLLGHSMGAIIAFELTRHLRHRQHAGPRCLVVSGCRAPHLPPPVPRLHELSDADLVRELHALGGIPQAVMSEPSFLRLFMGLLRADLAAFETYDYLPHAPIECPILALAGLSDPRVAVDDVEAWRAHAERCLVRRLAGDHFFVHSQQRRYLQEVAAMLPAAAIAGDRRPAVTQESSR